MSGPNKPFDPLMKELGSPTDPTSQLMKHLTPGTDPVAGMGKIEMPGTDPVAGMTKIEAPGTDPLSQVALNPQPLPPTNLQPGQAVGINPGPVQLPAVQSQGGHGVRNGIIAVLIIAVLLVGGTLTVESFRSGNSGAAPNQLAFLQPGVIVRQQQVVVSSNIGQGSGGAAVHAQSGSVNCNTTPTKGLVEHLIGGGVLGGGGDQAVIGSRPVNDSWNAVFAPDTANHTETIVAVCLRETPSFFAPNHALDDVTSALIQISEPDGLALPKTFEANCPSGEHILGGGFYSTVGAGTARYSIDASYPTSSGGSDAWTVVIRPNLGGAISIEAKAYAICSATIPTHLESTSLPTSGGSEDISIQKNMSCASGVLLTGGYAFSFPKTATQNPYISNDSPVNEKTNTPKSGDAVQQWYFDALLVFKQVNLTGALWVVCWDQSNNATPTATTGSQPTATGATQPTNTPKPRATATATPKPRPTNTPAPACKVLLSGSGAMDANNFYLNVEVAAGIGHDSSVAQAQFSPASGLLSALNGAKFSDKGAGGSGLYNSLTCAQLESASYGVTSVPGSNNEVFLVKTAAGHLAKVLVTVTPGDPFPSFTWTTYKP